jgi:hypothetical protein
MDDVPFHVRQRLLPRAFFSLIIFWFHPSTLFILKNELYDFLCFHFNQVITILRPWQLVWSVNSSIFLGFLYLFSISSFKFGLFSILSFVVFVVLPSIRLFCSHDLTCEVWWPYSGLQLFNFSRFFLLTDFIFYFNLLYLNSWRLIIVGFFQFTFYEFSLAL